MNGIAGTPTPRQAWFKSIASLALIALAPLVLAGQERPATVESGREAELKLRVSQLVWNINGHLLAMKSCDDDDPAIKASQQRIYLNPNFVALRDWMRATNPVMPPQLQDGVEASDPSRETCLLTVDRIIDAVDRNADDIARALALAAREPADLQPDDNGVD